MTGMAQSAPPIFARKATGLVREGSASSVLIYNINFVSIGLMLVFALIMIPAFYPGANVEGTFLASFIVVVPTSLVFAMLAAAMPRSGGDYVYVSRILGPQWGMMSSFNNTIWWILYGGVPSAFFAYYGLTPLLRGLGILTNNATLVRYGNDLSTPTGAFIIGTLLIIVLVVIFATGLNFYFKIQNALFIIAMIGIAVTIGILLTTSHADFVAAFNHYIGRSTGHLDSYPDHLDLPGTGIQPILCLHRRRGPAARAGAAMVNAGSGRRQHRRRHDHRLADGPGGWYLVPRRRRLRQRRGDRFRLDPCLHRAGRLRFAQRLVGADRDLQLPVLVLLLVARADPERVAELARIRHRRGDACLARTGQLQAAHASQRAGRDGHRLHRGTVALHQTDRPIQDADRHLRLHPELLDGVAGRDAVPLPATRDMAGVAGKLALGPDPGDHGGRGAELRHLRLHGLGLFERPSFRPEHRAASHRRALRPPGFRDVHTQHPHLGGRLDRVPDSEDD